MGFNGSSQKSLMVKIFAVGHPRFRDKLGLLLKTAQGSSQKSLVIKIFAVGHLKIVDFPALAKNDKLLSFLQKSDAFLPQFNPKSR